MDSTPIPARLLAPWIDDNASFLGVELEGRRKRMESLSGKRDELVGAGLVRMASAVDPLPLAAVDAAVMDVALGDMISTLVQVVRVADDGTTTLLPPARFTGVNGIEMSLARTPIRVAAECAELALSEGVTIADTSFWSLLMEVNQAITRAENAKHCELLQKAVVRLVREGSFLRTLRNPLVIAMSKKNQTCKIGGGLVSDREALGRILRAGEYLAPERLVDGTGGHFGVEHRGFTDAERAEITRHYRERLGVTFYKPHSWSRAFRIEAHLDLLRDEDWLAALLSAVARHTASRSGREPWPQFMADWTSKHVSAIGKLYGELNFHRTPYFDPARIVTGRARP